ncbi:hypothetical protein ACP70R_048929 [Stipagrostis hirtigluma subsp. patula]
MEASRNKLVNRNEITDEAASAFADSAQIPDKYVRTDEVADGVVVGEDGTNELPIIDMAKLLDPKMSKMEAAKLGSACRHWGFFQLINHGVNEAVIQHMKDNTAQFFALPLDSKKTVAVRGDGFEGYGHHYTRTSATSGDKLDWAESVILITQPVQDGNMPLWPTNPPTFRQALDLYSVEITNLTRQLLGFMADDLGVEQAALLDAFAGKRQSMAIHHYPPCRHPEKVMGNTPHTDGLGLTLLLHVDDTPGLQIKKGGRWFPVRPVPGAFVVNVGDILHIMTNGAYRSVEHRVVVDAVRGRTTAVIFQDASVEGMVAPLPELVKGGGARYKSVERFQYLKVRFSALAKGSGFLESFKV